MIVATPTRVGLLVGFGAISAAVVLWSLLRPAVPELISVQLTPAAIESLAVHVAPSAPMRDVDDYAIHLPALPAASAGTRPLPTPPLPAWRVSAILISGDRPVAIIDDRPVHPGDTLRGGGTVERIDAAGVVVIDARGQRHTLRVGGR